MRDALLIVCVGAAFLAGFPLMKRLDRWLNRHVAPPKEDAPGEGDDDASAGTKGKDEAR